MFLHGKTLLELPLSKKRFQNATRCFLLSKMCWSTEKWHESMFTARKRNFLLMKYFTWKRNVLRELLSSEITFYLSTNSISAIILILNNNKATEISDEEPFENLKWSTICKHKTFHICPLKVFQICTIVPTIALHATRRFFDHFKYKTSNLNCK